MWNFPLFPDQASTIAPQVDTVYFVLLGLSAVFGTLVVGLLVYFGVKYRRGSRADRSRPVSHNLKLELCFVDRADHPGPGGVCMGGKYFLSI